MCGQKYQNMGSMANSDPQNVTLKGQLLLWGFSFPGSYVADLALWICKCLGAHSAKADIRILDSTSASLLMSIHWPWAINP